MPLTITDELKTIIAAARANQEDLLINALAGSGKTTALLECIKVMPHKSILLTAFNKRIADELTQRLPPPNKTRVVVVKTFHALGLSIIKHHFPNVAVDKDATENLIQSAIGNSRCGWDIKRAAVRVVRAAKEALKVAAPEAIPSTHDLLDLGWSLSLFGKLRSDQCANVVELAHKAIKQSPKAPTAIDFCDMVWLPLWLNLAPPSRYQAIVIDELQDISWPQVQMINRLKIPTTRTIGVGDRHQQIYTFRGSIGEDAWQAFHGRHLPLTITWRCPRSIVKQANSIVGELKAAPSAPEGRVDFCVLDELPQRLTDPASTFVLSRTNAALLDCALFLWRSNVKFQLNAGQELLEPVFNLLDYVLDLRSQSLFLASLEEWHRKETAKGEAAGAVAWLERINEQRAILEMALKYAKPTAIKGLLSSILAPDDRRVLLSTVHKVKGLEADRVFLLRQTFGRSRAGDDPIPQDELNIKYVAITRSKGYLCWVDLDGNTGNEDSIEALCEVVGEHAMVSSRLSPDSDTTKALKALGEQALQFPSIGDYRDP